MGYLDITELARRLFLDAKANNNWYEPGAVIDNKTPNANKASAYSTTSLRPTFGGRNNDSSYQRDKSQDKCAICGKLGHWARDCSQNKNGKPKLTTLRLVSKKVKFPKDLGTGNINLLFLVVLQLFDIKGQTSSGAQNVVVGRVLTTLKRMVNLLREQHYQRRIPLLEPQ